MRGDEKAERFVMRKLGVLVWCLLFAPRCFAVEPANGQGANRIGQGDLRDLYKELKEQKRDKDVEIYYKQETVIKEPEDQDAYLKHLLSELNKTLKKGKKQGVVRRVQGDLVEIDKGSVHKIRERDVYVVYDSSDRYKAKLEVEAIADATSIAVSYEREKKIEPGDAVRFRGQRKLLELGLIYGFDGIGGSRKYSGLGMIWEYNLRSGWGFDFLGTNFERIWEKRFDGEWQDGRFRIPLALGVRKYFYYPFWVSPFVGLGGSYLKVDLTHTYTGYPAAEGESQLSTIRLMPYFVIGTQFSGAQFHLNLEARYFHGPKLNIDPEPVKIRPIIYCASISFAW